MGGVSYPRSIKMFEGLEVRKGAIPINREDQGEQGNGKGEADILPAGERHTLGGVCLAWCKIVGASTIWATPGRWTCT